MTVFHELTGEGKAFQKKTLFIFARHVEIPLLRWSYRLLRGDLKAIGRMRWFRFLMSRFVARPIAKYGDGAKPAPYEALVDEIKTLDCRIAVGPCRCRIVHDPCGHPIQTDMVIRTGTDAWLKAFPKEYRIIEKEEALSIVKSCRDAGMFHMLFFHYPSAGCSEYVICNCCLCGCVPFILNRDLGQANFPFLPGEWRAETDPEKCKACETCIASCPFEVRLLIDGVCRAPDCFGCGKCPSVCPNGAIAMEPSAGHGHGHGAETFA